MATTARHVTDDQAQVVAVQLTDLAINAAHIGLQAKGTVSPSEYVQLIRDLTESIMESTMRSPVWSDNMKEIARKRIDDTMTAADAVASLEG